MAIINSPMIEFPRARQSIIDATQLWLCLICLGVWRHPKDQESTMKELGHCMPKIGFGATENGNAVSLDL
jgi:hypothetical protein